MKKIVLPFFLLSCVLTISAQMSHPVMIWQGGNKMTLINVDSITFVQTPDVAESEFVDLGLSVKWAKCNLGATTESAYGNYYAWGETTTKTNYTWESYKYSAENNYYTLTKYVMNNSNYGYDGFKDGKYKIEASDDAATVNKGAAYRMPTYDEYLEMLDNCTFANETVNGHNGLRVTGPNGNSIFLPCAGDRNGQNRGGVGDLGNYWVGQTLNDDAYYISISRYNNEFKISTYSRAVGYSIRPVMP